MLIHCLCFGCLGWVGTGLQAQIERVEQNAESVSPCEVATTNFKDGDDDHNLGSDDIMHWVALSFAGGVCSHPLISRPSRAALCRIRGSPRQGTRSRSGSQPPRRGEPKKGRDGFNNSVMQQILGATHGPHIGHTWATHGPHGKTCKIAQSHLPTTTSSYIRI